MIIAVDIDNVLCNLQEVVIETFNERYRTEYTVDDFTEYDVENVLPVEHAVLMKSIYAEPEIYDKVKPIIGAKDGLRKLVDAGHSVYLVSDIIPSTYAYKVKFINHYFSFIDKEHIVSMSHKWLFKCDIMIEDNLHNLLAGHHYHRICLDAPWNQNVNDWARDIFRCTNWKDIVAMVEDINERESDIV